jgi:hypothetical protein
MSEQESVGSQNLPQIWRVSPLGRFGVLALIPLLAGVAWLTWDSVLITSLAVMGAVVSWWRFAWRPAVILTDTEVVVRNPNSTRRIQLRDVAHVDPGYGGLAIATSTGERVIVWAVQKSNLAKWTGRHTRADDVATAITRRSRSYAKA